MFSHATSHAKSSKNLKNSFTRRSLSVESAVIAKSEIIGKDKNGNVHYPYNAIKPPSFARRMSRGKSQNDEQVYTQEHEHVVKYISGTWQAVKRELDRKKDDTPAEGAPVYYREKESNPHLIDFRPFDMDGWLADRIYQKCMKSS